MLSIAWSLFFYHDAHSRKHFTNQVVLQERVGTAISPGQHTKKEILAHYFARTGDIQKEFPPDEEFQSGIWLLERRSTIKKLID